MLHPRPDDAAAAREQLEGMIDVAAPGPLAVLHPGASDPRRRWPPTAFAEVGDALAAAGARVVVTGTAAEGNLTGEVVERMRAPATDLAGRLDLAGLTGLLERAAVVVSNDTGPRHVAAARGVPTVAIYWCGNLVNAGPTFRDRHRTAVSWQMDCPVCGRDCMTDGCDHDASFVAGVDPAPVARAALDLLGDGGNGQSLTAPGATSRSRR